MRKDGKKRLGSILIVLALMFSMVVLLTTPVFAAVDINVSKISNLTYGETIWVNVSGLTPDNDYEVWIENATWETNLSEDTADVYGRVSMEVDIPYRNPLGAYDLIVLDVTGTPNPGSPDATQTINIDNTYLVKMKVNDNEVSYLLHNRTYEYGGALELSFEIYNGSDFIDEWDLETTLLDPAGGYVANNTITNGKWIPNIVTLGYIGDLPNLEVNYWLSVTPSSGHAGESTNISIPVKLNVSTTVSPTDLTYGDEDVTVTIYVKDWNYDDDEDLNVNGYTVKVYAPMTGGAYMMVDSDYTGSNGRAILNFDTTAGSAGTWYIGTFDDTASYRIDEIEKLNIADFIAYASFTVASDERANLKVESPDEIVTGFITNFNVSAYVSDPDDIDNTYYDELKIHVTGLDAYYNSIEYNYDDIITIDDAWFTGLSDNEKYAYYEFNITFNETGTGTILVTHPENNSVYMEWDNQDILANITGSVTFNVVSPAAMTIIVEDMVEEVLVDETTACRWQNISTIITLNVYGDTAEDHMNVSIEITGCGLDISVDEDDAYEDKYPVNWISDGVYEIEISPKTAGTLTITVTNDTEDKTVSKDYTVTGLFGTVTTSVGDDLEIPVETEEKITATITNGQYAEVHVTYFDEDWNFISCLNDSVGDNTAGNGLNGIFEFDITEDDIDDGVGNIVVAASAGSNYMYDIVEVVPIHDLVIQITKPTNATDLSLTVGIEHTYELKVYLDGKLMEDIGTVIGKITDADHDEDDPLQTVEFSEKSGSIWKIQDWEPWYAGTLVITATNDTGVNEHDGNVSLDVGYATISYSPDTATAGIDTEDLEVEVTGVDANGDLLPDGTKLYLNIEDDWSIEPKDSTEILTLNEDATDTFTITTVGDNATIINATLLAFYNPSDSDANKTTGVFTVGYPDFTVTPSEIYINYPTELTIIAKDNEGNPIEGINITLVSSSGGVLSVQPDPVETDEDGMVLLSVSPQASGKLNVTIARDVEYVGGVLTWTNAVITDTYITVTGIKTMLLELSKTPIYQGETLTVTVKYGATPISDVDVTLGLVTVKTGTDGVAQFTVPDPGVDYAIMKVIAKKTGYISVSEDLTVLKKWEIKVSGPSDVNTEASFTVTVVAKGSGLAGATATFQDQTQTTDNDGKATFTAPATEGTYTVTATYENMQTGTLSITVKKATTPGFELLTLIVAIGVAFILLRRRRK